MALNSESDWQNAYFKLKERGTHLLQSQKLVDCHFLVGPTTNQREISSHKLFLAMASPVFERMFYGNFTDDTNPILIPDVDPDAFDTMLKYIYTDTVNVRTFDMAWNLCYAAKKYMIQHLQEQCTKFLWTYLSPTSACRTYEFAKLFEEQALMNSSMKVIQLKTMEVIADPSFLEIEMDTLMDILEQDNLTVNSELDLYNALIKYAQRHGMITEDSEFSTSKSSLEEIKAEEEPPLSKEELMQAESNMQKLREAIMKIRFLTLTPTEFSEGPAHSKVLQQHEAFAIMNNIFCPTIEYSPMPEGFSTCRQLRSKFIDEQKYDQPQISTTTEKLSLDEALKKIFN